MRKRMTLDSIAEWSLTVLVGLTPFFVIPTAWATVSQAKLLLAAMLIVVALVSWLIARLWEGTILVPRSALVFAAGLLPLAYYISALASHAPAGSYASGSAGQDTVAALVVLFMALALPAVLYSGSARDIVRPLGSFLIGSAVVVVFQILHLFVPGWFTLGGAMTGSASSVFGSWHDLAILVALIVFFVSMIWTSPLLARGRTQFTLIILGVLSFLLLVVMGVSDVWYALGALSLLAAFYQWSNARLRERKTNADAAWRAAVSLFIGALALVCAWGGGFIYDHLPARLQIVQTEVRPSWQGTLAVGEKVFGGGGGLIFGSGPNTFTRAWGLFKPSGVNQTDFWNVDFNTGVGLIPTSFITTGILGALAWLALLLALVWRAWRFARNGRNSPARSIHAALLGGALFLAADHIIYSPGIAVSLLLFFLMGLFTALEIAEHSTPSIKVPLRADTWARIFSIVGVVAFLAVIAWAGVAATRATLSDMFVAKSASDYNAGGDIPHSLRLLQQALVIYPSNDAAHRAAIELGLVQLQQLIASGNASSSAATLQATLSQTIAEGLQAVSINSGNYQNWLALAQLYQSLASVGVQGAYQNALSAYQKAAVANPTNPLPLVGAAQVAIAQNDATSTINYLNAAIALKANFAAAYYLRSQAEAGQGDFTNGIQDAKNAVSLAKQDPLGWYNLGTILYASGDYPNAVVALQQAVSLSNTYANALFVLSLADDKLGDHANALNAMQQVITLNPSDTTAQSVLANLQAGRPALTAATSTPAKGKK